MCILSLGDTLVPPPQLILFEETRERVGEREREREIEERRERKESYMVVTGREGEECSSIIFLPLLLSIPFHSLVLLS